MPTSIAVTNPIPTSPHPHPHTHQPPQHTMRLQHDAAMDPQQPVSARLNTTPSPYPAPGQIRPPITRYNRDRAATPCLMSFLGRVYDCRDGRYGRYQIIGSAWFKSRTQSLSQIRRHWDLTRPSMALHSPPFPHCSATAAAKSSRRSVVRTRGTPLGDPVRAQVAPPAPAGRTARPHRRDDSVHGEDGPPGVLDLLLALQPEHESVTVCCRDGG